MGFPCLIGDRVGFGWYGCAFGAGGYANAAPLSVVLEAVVCAGEFAVRHPAEGQGRAPMDADILEYVHSRRASECHEILAKQAES